MVQVDEQYDVLILGRGAAAHGAAIYATRYGMRAAMFGESFGGETAIGSSIENYPGYLQIDGYDLMVNMKEQVDALQVTTISEDVEELRRETDCYLALAGGRWYQGQAVIYAVGRERRKLGLSHEDELLGRGISYCATCDAPLYRGKRAAVVGGGDSAVKGALLLAKYATQAYVIYRGESFTRPEPIAVERVNSTPNITVLYGTNVTALKEDGPGLTGVVLDKQANGHSELELEGLFVEIGADPRTELVQPLGIALNDLGEVVVDKLMQTNLPGLFAAGDITDASGDLKQTVTAVAQGAIAATSAYKHVAAHPDSCQLHAVGYRLD